MYVICHAHEEHTTNGQHVVMKYPMHTIMLMKVVHAMPNVSNAMLVNTDAMGARMFHQYYA